MKVSSAVKIIEQQTQLRMGYPLVSKAANSIPDVVVSCQPPATLTHAIIVHVSQYSPIKNNRIVDVRDSYFDADDTLMSLQNRMRLLANVSQTEKTSVKI